MVPRTSAIELRASRQSAGRGQRQRDQASAPAIQSRMCEGHASIFDGQHEQGAGSGRLQRLERLPEDVLAAHRVDGDLVGAALERNDGRRLAAGQQALRIAGSAERGACSMMYLLSRTCCTPSMRISSRSTQSALSGGRCERRAQRCTA
jgi:hypothetical protein